MKFLIFLVLWLILLAVAPWLAIGALILIPLLWLIALPFRLLWYVLEALLGLVRGILLLPARVLSGRV